MRQRTRYQIGDKIFGHYVVKHMQGREKEAKQDFQTAIQLDPTFAPAHLNLGVILANDENWVAALKAFEAAEKLGFPGAAQYVDRARAALDQDTARS